jgi:hypothetical protein
MTTVLLLLGLVITIWLFDLARDRLRARREFHGAGDYKRALVRLRAINEARHGRAPTG